MTVIYYHLKRKVMRLRCRFGHHAIKMSALGYRKPGCIWCGIGL